MSLIRDTAHKLGIEPSLVFSFAHAYSDNHKAYDPIRALLLWERDGRVVAWVENFCIDVMAGRTNVMNPCPQPGDACLFED